MSVGHEHEVLVHHADAGVDCLTSAPAGDVAAVEHDRAAVRVMQAGQDPHERRLARAVFADERVDLASRHFEIRVSVRFNVAEPLPDSLRGQKR